MKQNEAMGKQRKWTHSLLKQEFCGETEIYCLAILK